MKYTIKDLSEGKCAVKNDGTLEELREVLKLAFPNVKTLAAGGTTYYYTHNKQTNVWDASPYTTLPTQSVKDFLIKSEHKDKNHSWKDYKEGDYVVITEYKGKTNWEHWFMPGEVLKLGGKFWDGNISKRFRACSKGKPEGCGMIRSFEENYKIRKATQEEINNSQWGVKIDTSIGLVIDQNPKINLNFIPPYQNIETKPTELKVKLRNKRIRIKL